MFNPITLKNDFPLLRRRVHGMPLVYLDNASTTQKPKEVLDTLEQYYRKTNANIHRGVHTLSEEATAAYEAAREKIAAFIGAKPDEIVFTRNTTEAINLVARTWGAQNVKRGDTIVTTEMEHHSNLLPWKWLTEEKNARLEIIPVTDDGQLELTRHPELAEGSRRIRLITVTHMSNVLGTINPIKKIATWAHARGALVLVDGAKSIAHMPVNVRKLSCDFFVFSGHKMGGPTGIGVLWARRELLENMEPFLYGGDMVKTVKFQVLSTKSQVSTNRDDSHRHPEPVEGSRSEITATWNDVPHKFEAGTPNIAGAIGLGAAVDYLTKIGMNNVHQHIQALTRYALQKLDKLSGIRVLGPRDVRKRGGAVAFTVAGIHPHDLATILDRDGIAIRSGHHCAMPLHERFGIDATARASFWIYNTKADVDQLMSGIQKAQKIFRRASKASKASLASSA